MREFNPIITVALTIVLLVFVILYLRTLTLEQIREAVYNAFLTAETNFNHGENTEKLNYAVQTARLALESLPIPTIVKAIVLPLITTENLTKIVDMWFKQVKALVQQVPTNEEIDKVIEGR